VRRVALTVACALAPALALPGTSGAALFPGDALSDPAAQVKSLGGLDVARDGSGALVYLARSEAADHVFASRFVDGAWSPAEPIDAGLTGDSSQPVVATAAGGRVAVAFVHAGALYAATRPSSGAPWSAPVTLDAGPGIGSPTIDMGIGGVAYVAYVKPAAAGAGGDVRVARFAGNAWSAVDAVLDIEPARDAGSGPGRPRVAISADNNAVVAWGEVDAGGIRHLFARRLTGTTPSVAPQELTVPAFDGRTGLTAESPEIAIENDNSYAWVVFRQAFDLGGTPRWRALARRLRGGTFDPPAAIDGLTFDSGEGAGAPRIALNGRGQALATVALESSRQTVAAQLIKDAFAPGARLDSLANAAPSLSVAAIGEDVPQGLVVWQQDPGGAPELRARTYEARGRLDAGVFTDERVLSRPELGPVDAAAGLAAAADGRGSAIVAFVQGPPTARRIVIAAQDLPPTRPIGETAQGFQRTRRPLLTWRNGLDEWGQVSYQVELDGQQLPPVTASRLALAADLPDGIHRWRVVAIDGRGQRTPSTMRGLRVDLTPPQVVVRVRGVRRVHQRLVFLLNASDGTPGRSAGLRSLRVDFGDGTSTTLAASGRVEHRYAGRGLVTLRLTARDRIGNRSESELRLRIRGAPRRKARRHRR